MGKYIFQRFVYALLTIFIIATITFVLMETLPGSPFNDEQLTDFQKEQLNERYGLNEPFLTRYVKYLGNLAKGDLGVSYQSDGRPVTKIIKEKLGPSAILGVQALILGSVMGLILGTIAALRHNNLGGYLATILSVLGLSIPSFVFAGILQYWVGVRLQWLPVAFWDGFEYSIMATISLSMLVVASVARFLRTELLEVLSEDYMAMARSKGLNNYFIIIRHGIKNALIPVISIMGPLVVSLVTGTLVIEKIFSIPGLGEQFVNSILTNDYPVIIGITLYLSVLFIAVIFIVDMLYMLLDPRIRLAGEENK